MNEKIQKLENKLSQAEAQRKASVQGSQERKDLNDECEKLENELNELLVENGVELNSWDW